MPSMRSYAGKICKSRGLLSFAKHIIFLLKKWFKQMKCKRCSKEAHYLEKCNYCEKEVCRACQKSSRNAKNTARKRERRVICKTCWGHIPSRKTFLKDPKLF